MAKIHPLSVVDPKAELADDVEIGPFCTVGPHVKVGAGCRLISHVVLDGVTTIGARNTFYPFAAVGTLAQDVRSHPEDACLVVGDDNIFRENTTAHVGTEKEVKLTTIGSRNWFLAGSHIAHDCVVGNDIIMSNNVMLAGHVIVEDRAIIGGGVGILQFTHIGKGCMISGMSGVGRDVIPYGIVMNNALAGLNLVGLRRAGVENAVILNLQQAYKDLFENKDEEFAVKLARVEANAAYKDNALVQDVIRFLKNPSRNNILQPR